MSEDQASYGVKKSFTDYPPIVAIDFDGTIRRGKRLSDKGTELMPGCREAIELLYKKGCRLIVWTCREEHAFIEKVLRKNNIFQYFIGINKNAPGIDWGCRKIYADYYIDDLNLGGFPGWEKAYSTIIQDDYFFKKGIR